MLTAPSAASAQFHRLETGVWRAALDLTGTDASGKAFSAGELPFRLELARGESGVRAWIVNGEERSEIPAVTWAEGKLTLSIDDYDSTIEAAVSEDGKVMEGWWKKRRGLEKWGEARFSATAGDQPRFALPPAKPERGGEPTDPLPLAERWRVSFEGDADPAVGVFSMDTKSNVVRGTFLTSTGDYRYLAGEYRDNVLRLSVFDGAHAFLITARQVSSGRLEGDFWSGTWSHSRWSAVSDPAAAIPDGWGAVAITRPDATSEIKGLALDSSPATLADFTRGGRAALAVVFGSWCPNCRDANAHAAELHAKYASRGLKVVGLGFELTGDQTRDLNQLRTYVNRREIPFPVMLAGISDKSKAATALPVIERLKAYPTLLFIDRSGRVDAVYTGYSGPATGEANIALRRAIDQRIERLLE